MTSELRLPCCDEAMFDFIQKNGKAWIRCAACKAESPKANIEHVLWKVCMTAWMRSLEQEG